MINHLIFEKHWVTISNSPFKVTNLRIHPIYGIFLWFIFQIWVLLMTLMCIYFHFFFNFSLNTERQELNAVIVFMNTNLKRIIFIIVISCTLSYTSHHHMFMKITKLYSVWFYYYYYYYLSCHCACGILIPWPGIESMFPAVECRFLTTGLLGKSLLVLGLLCCCCC